MKAWHSPACGRHSRLSAIAFVVDFAAAGSASSNRAAVPVAFESLVAIVSAPMLLRAIISMECGGLPAL